MVHLWLATEHILKEYEVNLPRNVAVNIKKCTTEHRDFSGYRVCARVCVFELLCVCDKIDDQRQRKNRKEVSWQRRWYKGEREVEIGKSNRFPNPPVWREGSRDDETAYENARHGVSEQRRLYKFYSPWVGQSLHSPLGILKRGAMVMKSSNHIDRRRVGLQRKKLNTFIARVVVLSFNEQQ